MNSGTMLNAYPDSLGGRLSAAAALLDKPEMRGAFRSFYILPSVFNTDLDRGFSVISYDLNRELAAREDLECLQAQGIDLKLDFILNHLSVLSPQFQDVLEKGDASPYRDFFIDWNRFWSGKGTMMEEGYIQPDPALIQDMFFRKPGLPILMVRFPDGRDVPYWNTFYQEVHYDLPDEQDLMRALHLQYGTASRLAERIAAAAEAGRKPSEADLSGLLADNEKKPLLDYLEGRRKYLGQMDVNIRSPQVWEYYGEVLDRLAEYGASIVRLDAFGYASKIPGRKNFMNDPETWEILERVYGMAEKRGLTLLPEIHAAYSEGSYRMLAEKGYMTYDFFLPGLVIDAIENHDPGTMIRWAREQKEKNIRCVNMLGCHDGIPMLDLKGLVPDERIEQLIALIVRRGGLIKNLHGKKNLYYQVNATYFSALGADERKMLLARALQLFMPGKPQVWYLDLFAGENDLEAVRRGGEAAHKEINRTNLSEADVERQLSRPLVRKQLQLLKMRNASEAFGFDAEMTAEEPAPGRIRIHWERNGQTATLEADLTDCAFRAEADTPGGLLRFAQD
jgi:sucrose phosphorylase